MSYIAEHKLMKELLQKIEAQIQLLECDKARILEEQQKLPSLNDLMDTCRHQFRLKRYDIKPAGSDPCEVSLSFNLNELPRLKEAFGQLIQGLGFPARVDSRTRVFYGAAAFHLAKLWIEDGYPEGNNLHRALMVVQESADKRNPKPKLPFKLLSMP